MSKSYPVNLPNTAFCQRANSAVREPELQRFWSEQQVYAKNTAQRAGNKKFVLHDGPPYASAPAVHMGTALNKVLKDVLVKYKALRGYYAPFVPGYDTHGLPIENAVLKTVKGGRSAITALALRERCAEHAQTNVDGQEEQFKRLGVLADWKNRYLTMDKEFEAAQVRVFAAMAHKGYLYKGLKPVHWCPNCETALANAEVEEKDYTCESVHVLFKLADSSRDRLPGFVPEGARVSFVAWTTTPWSLPGNTALAVNADLEYDFLETGEHGVLVVARALRDEFLQAVGLSYVSLLGCVKGRELEHVDARHPWLDRLSPVVLSRHVLPTMGTGVVHLAPGFGAEDYKVGRAYKLAVLCPMDGKGLLTQETSPFAGMHFEKANAAITEHLRALNKLLHSARYTHKYPHCWRCEKPLVERATPQWFASVNACKDAALAAVDAVEWLPATGHNRILGFLEERDDWCVSRQRAGCSLAGLRLPGLRRAADDRGKRRARCLRVRAGRLQLLVAARSGALPGQRIRLRSMRRQAVQQGDGHDGRLVRLGSQPCRRRRQASRAARLAVRDGSRRQRSASRLVSVAAVDQRHAQRTCALQDRAHARFRPRRERREDVQEKGQRRQPR